MKILIKIDTQVQEELEAIACGLSKMGHMVHMFDGSIFKVADEMQAEYLIVTEQNTTRDIVDYKIKKHTYKWNGERFGNTVKYQKSVYDDRISTDLLVISSPTIGGFLPILERVNIRVKICGNPIPSPYFIGMANLNEISRLCASAKVVYVDNLVIRDSLLLNGICAVSTFNQATVDFISNNTERENYILAEQKNILTEVEIAGKIDEDTGHFNR